MGDAIGRTPPQHPAERASGATPPQLGERDQRVLEFERAWVSHVGAKEQAIRQEFGLSAARYYQVLHALLDSPAALAFDPMLIRRLQRVRDTRLAARSARLLPPGE